MTDHRNHVSADSERGAPLTGAALAQWCYNFPNLAARTIEGLRHDAQAVEVPDGYVLVPREPSQQIIDRMTASIDVADVPTDDDPPDRDYDYDMRKAYRAALSFAAQPPAAPVEGMTYNTIKAAFDEFRKTLTVMDTRPSFDSFSQGYVAGWNAKEAQPHNGSSAGNASECGWEPPTRIATEPQAVVTRGWQNEKPEAVEYRRGFRAGWDEAVRISSALSRPHGGIEDCDCIGAVIGQHDRSCPLASHQGNCK